MSCEQSVSAEDAALEAEIFSKVDKFDWADEQMECLEIDASECLSRRLLENSPRKSSVLPALGRTSSVRNRRKARCGGRKPNTTQKGTEKANRNGKRQPSGQGHVAKADKPEKNAGKGSTKGVANNGGDTGRQHNHGPESRDGRPKGNPKSVRQQQARRKRSDSAGSNRTNHPRSIVISPRQGGCCDSARGSQADISSDWKADKLSNCGGSTHRSCSSSSSSGSSFRSPRKNRNAKKKGGRRVNDAGSPNSRGGPLATLRGNRPSGTNGTAKTCQAEHMEDWRRGVGRPSGQETFTTHNRDICTAATSAY